MFKKIELWIVCLLIIFFITILVLYERILVHSHLDGLKFKFFQFTAVFMSKMLHNLKQIFIISKERKKNILVPSISNLSLIEEKNFHNYYYKMPYINLI